MDVFISTKLDLQVSQSEDDWALLKRQNSCSPVKIGSSYFWVQYMPSGLKPVYRLTASQWRSKKVCATSLVCFGCGQSPQLPFPTFWQSLGLSSASNFNASYLFTFLALLFLLSLLLTKSGDHSIKFLRVSVSVVVLWSLSLQSPVTEIALGHPLVSTLAVIQKGLPG